MWHAIFQYFKNNQILMACELRTSESVLSLSFKELFFLKAREPVLDVHKGIVLEFRNRGNVDRAGTIATLVRRNNDKYARRLCDAGDE